MLLKEDKCVNSIFNLLLWLSSMALKFTPTLDVLKRRNHLKRRKLYMHGKHYIYMILCLAASTPFYRHFFHHLILDYVVLIFVQDANGFQRCRHTTGRWKFFINPTHLLLYNSMGGGVHVLREGKWTFTTAIVCIKTTRSNIGIIFSIKFRELDKQRMPSTVVTTCPHGKFACCKEEDKQS